MKALVLFHRWVGVALCLMFATWFATGAVMIFVAFPSLPEADRAAAAPPVDLGALRIAPAEAARRLGGAGALRLVGVEGEPVFAAAGPDGRDRAISGRTGAALAPIGRDQAGRIAAAFGRAPVRHVDGPFDYDQWNVHQQFDRLRPFYRVRLDDPRGTELYVSGRTGEVAQRTRADERAWNWVGSVVHWIYFTPIRKSFPAWDWTVWCLALVGLSTAVAGIWLGVSRTNRQLRSKRPSVSPFRGLLRWHHVLGLAAGAFLLCWITSGWLSMDHGRLFSEGQAAAAAARAYAGGPAPAGGSSLTLADLGRLQPASSIEFGRVAGHDLAAARGPAGPQVLVAGPGGAVLADRLPLPLVLSAVRAAWPGERIAAARPVAADAPYAKAEGLAAGTLRVELNGPQPQSLFIDPVSGRILVAMDASRAAYAWVYYMLHTYNFPGLSSRPVLRIVIMLIPLTLGFGFSITGVLVGVRRLRIKTGR